MLQNIKTIDYEWLTTRLYYENNKN